MSNLPKWKPIEDTARAIFCVVILFGMFAELIMHGGWGWFVAIMVIVIFGMAS